MNCSLWVDATILHATLWIICKSMSSCSFCLQQAVWKMNIYLDPGENTSPIMCTECVKRPWRFNAPGAGYRNEIYRGSLWSVLNSWWKRERWCVNSSPPSPAICCPPQQNVELLANGCVCAFVLDFLGGNILAKPFDSKVGYADF